MDETRKAQTIGRKDVEHVAALASLALTTEELDRMSRDLGSILDYVAELQQVDTTGVEPLTHVSELFEGEPAGVDQRKDDVQASLAHGLVIGSAPATDGIFFKVPKVIER